jgi:prepilin-type processing-associated H-X9-DG protein
MKQVGLAIHMFEGSNDGLPPRKYSTGGISPMPASVGRASVLVMLLPYIEQGALAAQYDFRNDWRSSSSAPAATPTCATNNDRCPSNNNTVIDRPVPIYTCPSVPTTRNQVDEFTHGTFGTVRGAVTDYYPYDEIANNNSGAYATGAIWPTAGESPFQSGSTVGSLGFFETSNDHVALRSNLKTPFSFITDGTSNTILITEVAGRPQQWLAKGRSGSARIANGMWADHDMNSDVNLRGANFDGTGTGGPCLINCNNFRSVYSFHSGGINILMCDGAVRFLNENANKTVYASMVTRNAGEVLGELP